MKKNGENLRSWKGQTERVVEPVRHGWQIENARANGGRIDAPLRRMRRTLISFLLLAIAMLSAFVFLLLHSPVKTPMIIVGATSYVWPLPPNGWVKEDVEGLASLHGKAMHCKDSSKAWQSKSSCLEDLRTQLREASSIAKRARTIVLYLNMHGAVNEEGDACLIPPTASCIATTQWITMDELGESISANTPAGVRVLLVLDCVHQQVNWSIAQLNNTFVDRLAFWAAKSRPDSIVVLSSCSSDQRSWSGAELHNSIFGRELRLGLAGAADRRSNQSRMGTGNGDGAVSMRELTDYLAATVDGWAQSNRGTSQTPCTTPPSFEDFRVTWALKSGELDRQFASVQHSDLAVNTPSSDDLVELWRSMEELGSLAVYRHDPKNWADLEQKLLWLEQLSNAGSGYAELASKQVFPSLSKRLKESLERAKAVSNSNNEVAKANILQERAEAVELPSHLPSLALQEYIGEIPSITANILRGRIVSAAIDNEQSILKVAASVGFAPQASQLNELNFLGITKKYDCLANWPDQTTIQELFELRDQCERLVIRGDIRGHRWRRPALLAADKERRKAEDQLILGPTDSLLIGDNAKSWSGLRMALSQFDSSGDRGSLLVESAIRLRDQGLAEVAYLARWICSAETVFDNLGQWNKADSEKNPSQTNLQLLSNSQEITAPFFREQLAVQELSRLISGLHELSESLGKVSVLGDGKREQLIEVVDQVHRDLNSLKGLVRNHVERASRSSAESGDIVREVEVLLSLPFLTVDDRISLRKVYVQKIRDSILPNRSSQTVESEPVSTMPSRLGTTQFRTATASSSNENSATQRTRYADRMRNWGPHPLGELLVLKDGLSLESMSAQADSKANDRERELIAIDLLNSRLRRCFQSMQLFNSNRVEDWCKSAGVAHLFDAEPDGWTRSAFGEQFERAIAPVCPLQFESNNAISFRRLAFKDFLHWYANRISDDLYADANNDTTMNNSGESYFERSVRQVLDYAAQMQGSTWTMVESAKAVSEKIQFLGPLSRNGIRTSVKLSAPGADSDLVRFAVNVMPAVSTAGKQWKLPMPDGFATLLVRNSSGITNGSRVGVSMPVNGDQPAYNLVSPPLDSSLAHEAVLVYRGHEFRAPISAGEGYAVDFKPNYFDSAELALFGDTKRQASIVFVLDCSWSMGAEIPVEAIAMKSQSRLELAKESVLRMITQIAARPDARVGVRLFGHRLGWSRPVDAKTGASNGKTQVLVQPDYPESIPNDLVPSRDVEAILPLGRFTNDMIGGLAKKLSKIAPWGQSPLYLSIIESFGDFDADDNSTAKSIVIITDGDNFQFNASGRPGGEPGSITSLDGVYRAWNNNKVPLFILGVGVSDTENAKSRKNLLDLAEHAKGKYYDIENGSDLLRALSEQLSLGTFSVSKVNKDPRSKSPMSAREAKLNTPVVLEQVANQSYDVSFQSISKTVQFQGGESLELYLTEDGQDIVSKPYDRSSPRAATLVRTGESGRMIVRVHRPTQHRNGVNFPISIQDPDSHYTPRPNQLWIEITPVVTNTELPRQTYYFYDANFEPKTPVPMVSWNASNWPASAAAAEVRVWVKYEPTPNLQSIPFEHVKQNLQRYSEGIAVNGVEGVKLGINIMTNRAISGGLEVHITESHNDRSKGVGSIRVALETDESIVPSRVTRHFEKTNNMSVHRFEFEASSAEMFLASAKSRVTIQSRVAAHEGAWQLQAGQPIRVEVNSVPESLPHVKLPTLILPVPIGADAEKM